MKRKQTLELRGSIVQVHELRTKTKEPITQNLHNKLNTVQGKQGTTIVNQRPNQSK